MDLNKHIITSDTNKPFHSNGFAIVANGDHFGATDNTTFEQRKQISRNRRIINDYKRSAIVDASFKANPVGNRGVGIRSIPRRPSLKQRDGVNVSPRKFVEPTQRTYNPFP